MKQHHRNKARHGVAAPAWVLLACACGAQGANHVWTGPSSGAWSNPANWSAGVPASADSMTLQFRLLTSGSYALTNDLPAPFTLNAIYSFSSSPGSVTIAGSALRFVDNPAYAPDNSFHWAFLGHDDSGPAGPMIVHNDLLVDAELFRVYGGDLAQASLHLNGSLTGRGTLSAMGGNVVLAGASPHFAGTLDVSGAAVTLSPSAAIGPAARVIVEPYLDYAYDPRLILGAITNTAPGAIDVRGGGFVEAEQVTPALLSQISSKSAGTLALSPSSAAVQTLDLSRHPTLRLGVSHPGTAGAVTLSAQIIPASDTYRFGAGSQSRQVADETWARDIHYMDTLRVESVLSDAPGGMPRSVSIGDLPARRGSKIKLVNPSNSYSGGTVLEPVLSPFGTPSYLTFDYTPAPGQTPLGTGPLIVGGGLLVEGADGSIANLPNEILFRPGSLLILNSLVRDQNGLASRHHFDRWRDDRAMNLNGTAFTLTSPWTTASCVERAGALTFEGGNSLAVETSTGTTGPKGIEFSSVQRRGRGTLVFQTDTFSYDGSVGTVAILRSADWSAVRDPANGMLHPSIIIDANGRIEFARVNSAGAVQPMPYTAPDPLSDSEVAYTPAVRTDETVWAMRGRMDIFDGKTLTIRSGGLILDGSILGGSVSFTDHGAPVEGIIHTGNTGTVTMGSSISAADGITIFGRRTSRLTLSGNNTFSGPVTIHGGEVILGSSTALPSGNPLHVGFGAALELNGHSVTVSSLTGEGLVRTSQVGLTTLTVNASTDCDFAGPLWDRPAQGRTLSLVKTGPGTLMLTGTNPNSEHLLWGTPRYGGYAGTTAVEQGKLVLRESFKRYGAYITHPAGTIEFQTDHDITDLAGSGDTVISSGAIVTSPRVRQRALRIRDDSRLDLRTRDGVPSLSRLTSLVIEPGGTFDLGGNALIVGTTPATTEQVLADLSGWIDSARNSSPQPWLGEGLTTSAPGPGWGVAAILNRDEQGNPLFAEFQGEVVGASDVIVALAPEGDTDLDWAITADDYARIDRGFLERRLGYRWGDFDYRNGVTLDDYAMIDGAFLSQGASATTIVPEPNAMFLIPALLLRRRRR